ncbi:MAG: glycoside hydrolase family 3 protein [Oscillospiraceae bacterium]
MTVKNYTGSADMSVSARETENRRISAKAASEGVVLLENDGILPMEPCKIALYGCGAKYTVKGGTGSGDVNEREVVSIYEGLKNAGYTIVSEKWLNSFDDEYESARNAWKQSIFDYAERENTDIAAGYCSIPFEIPAGRPLTEEDIAEADSDTAVYVIRRCSGEFADRWEKKGDWYLSDKELSFVKQLSENFSHVIIVVNAGGMIDLSFMDDTDNISALIYFSQAGMESGNVFADIISGKVNPSGKLTDTYAYNYFDYPSSEHFSHNDGCLDKSVYTEGIYVGYRYFDSFDINPRYEFGYGLSYTFFDITDITAEAVNSTVKITASVKNTGSYSGKEVVQVYVSAPNGRLVKEYQRLAAFAKTGIIAPDETEKIGMEFDIRSCASYDTERAAYVLEKGNYIIRVGSSSKNTEEVCAVYLDREVICEQLENICPLSEEIEELSAPERDTDTVGSLPVISIDPADIPCNTPVYGRKHGTDALSRKAEEIAALLTDEELALTVCGHLSEGEGIVGITESRVPGAAGETSSVLKDKYGIDGIVTADGPAGIRIEQIYRVDGEGNIRRPTWMETVEKGFFADINEEGYTRRYQFCTAFPIGTMLAQTWNTELVEEVGRAVQRELAEFGISLWLAPGMNIHRNPLCGRNFEYYSEDPVVSGLMAAAMTRGVQSGEYAECGTTIKHFACNNQEDNRQHCDSVVSERALREIYLKGFEIAVKTSQPRSLMTSYNLINGVHAANCRDTVTKVLRDEWGFEGLVMTDWWTTGGGGSSRPGCIEAGNDLIMPGTGDDTREIAEAVKNGTLSREALIECAARVIRADLLMKVE